MRFCLRHAVATTIVITASSAFAEDFTYHTQYADQMGTEAPVARNLTEAISSADAGAVYANRNASEFSTVAYNWAPSSTPLRFDRGAVRPMSAEDLAHMESTNTDGFIVVKDGTIIREYYAAGMHPKTKHKVHSTGKNWTSAIWHDVLLPVMDKKVPECRVLPGRRRRSPASGSHRTQRADFPHCALRSVKDSQHSDSL